MMNLTANTPDRSAGFELRFQSLFKQGRGLAFPCNAAGQVDLDTLPDRARNNYFYARALMGREFAAPILQVNVLH